MRWSYRIGPCLSSTYRARNTQLGQLIIAPKSAPSWQRALCPPLRRTFSNTPITASQVKRDTQDARHGSKDGAKPRKKRSSLSYVVAVGGVLATVTTILWVSGISGGQGSSRDIINRSTFTAFTITSKEQVSPTAFILTVRSSSSSSNSSAGGSARIREAWAHGLWSVEIKQPQLQIARHYTPLPPPFTVSAPKNPTATPTTPTKGDAVAPVGQESGDELRFLIRKMDGGEMSSYLSRLRVGDAVWLRGPHLGFDVARRLGDDGGAGTGTGAGRSVVFLAGGTGIAPALQVARRLLDYDNNANAASDDGGNERKTLATAVVDKPVISILWANRRSIDALGRRTPAAAGVGSWSIKRLWKRGASEDDSDRGDEKTEEEQLSSLSRQIRDMEKRYPDNFRVRYFVDEEKSFIGAADVITTAATATPREQKSVSRPGQLTTPPAAECPWHSAAALAKLPNDDDASRRSVDGVGGSGSHGPDLLCPCVRTPGERAGVNLLFVSGPDGFIEAYAGPKQWHEGGEMQGPVRGLVGRLTGRQGELDGWLVLKL